MAYAKKIKPQSAMIEYDELFLILDLGDENCLVVNPASVVCLNIIDNEEIGYEKIIDYIKNSYEKDSSNVYGVHVYLLEGDEFTPDHIGAFPSVIYLKFIFCERPVKKSKNRLRW